MITDPASTALDQAIAFRIYRLQRLLRLNLARFLSEQDTPLVPETYFLLVRLVACDGVRQGDLVDPAIGDRPNISRHIAKMESEGLVLRKPDLTDARARTVHLTAVGRALFERLHPAVVRERERLFGDLCDTDLSAFLRVLDHLEHDLTD